MKKALKNILPPEIKALHEAEAARQPQTARKARDHEGSEEPLTPPTKIAGTYGIHRFVEYLRNEDTGHTAARFKLTSFDRVIEFIMPLEQGAKPKDLKDRLASYGIPHSDGTIDWLASHGRQYAPATTVVSVGGWRGDVLVNCFGTFGDPDKVDAFQFDPQSNWARDYVPSGDWRKLLRAVKPILEASQLLTFLHCVGLWAPLADRLSFEGGLAFCITGASSTGKTTATMYVLSLTSRALLGDLVSVNLTPGYVDAALPAFGGAVVPFADLKTSTLRNAQLMGFVRDIVFGITESARRMRLTDQTKAKAGGYKIAVISYETSVARLCEQSGVLLEGGESRRLFDLEVQGETGIFDLMTDAIESSAMVRTLESLTRQHHGVLSAEWIERIATESDLRAEHDRAKEVFLRKFPGLSGFDRRVCEEFANIYSAGVLARKFKMLPVSNEHLIQSVERYFLQNLQRRKDIQAAIDEFKAAIVARLTDEANYPVAILGCPINDKRAETQGFFRDEKGRRYLYASLEFASKVGAPPVNADEIVRQHVLRPLAEAQVLRASKNREFASPVRQQGLGRRRFLRLDFDKLKAHFAAP